jgi:hypothetical protein
MANFNIQITNVGRALQAKAQTGVPLVFTRMRIGSGTITSQQIADLTSLIQPQMWLTLNKSVAQTGGKHIVGAAFSNAEVLTGFYFREIGVFAQDPTAGEILYCYGNAGSVAEYIPAAGGSDILERQLDIITLIGNATNVSATIDETLVFATMDNLNTHEVDPQAHGVDVIKADLATAASVAKTISQGVSIVTTNRTSRFLDMYFAGRTLVNLLGRVRVSRTDVTSGTSNWHYTNRASLTAGKKYIAVAENAVNVTGIHILPVGEAEYFPMPSTGKTRYLKFSPSYTADYDFRYLVETTGVLTTVWAAIYEITQAEYDAIDSMTAAQVAARWTYVDDMKNTNAVYAINPGKNLAGPFSEWTSPAVMPTLVGAYKSVASKATATPDYSHVIVVPVIGGQTYSFSAEVTISNIGGTIGVGAYYNLTPIAADGTFLTELGSPPYATTNGTTTISKTVTMPSNAVAMRVVLGVDTATGTFTFANPMLNIGSTALPFEPQKPSYVFLPDVQARSNVDGSVADEFYMDGSGNPGIVRRFREMVLDGSLLYTHANSVTGYKWIRTSSNGIAPPVRDTGVIVKYDGKILSRVLQGVAPSAADQQVVLDSTDLNPNSLLITISNSDSGWPDGYSPTADEANAVFYGYKMCNPDGTYPWDGVSTKTWREIRTDDSLSAMVQTVPTTQSTSALWSPYRLQYQLAQSVDEAVAHEGALMLHDGANQIEMGTGVVVRERISAFDTVTGNYYFNGAANTASYPVHPVNKIFTLYSDSVKQAATIMPIVSGATNKDKRGNEQAYLSSNQFNPSSAYSVTYIAIDTYKIGFAPQSITGYASPNIKETVDDAVEAITGLQRDLSVMQATKAGKQQPQRIAPTLLNGWGNKGSGFPTIGYVKYDNDEVEVFGDITGGVTTQGTAIMYLPVKHRPKNALLFDVATYNGASWAIGTVIVGTDGKVSVDRGISADHVIFRSVKFRIEQ